MRACSECFKSTTWIENASPTKFSPANCDFGHGFSQRTWSTQAWIDSFDKLLLIYELTEGDYSKPIHEIIQTDWEIFNLEPQKVLLFLQSLYVNGHDFLSEDSRVRLKQKSDGSINDHSTSWVAFSKEIRFRNRFFPKTHPEQELLKRVLLDNIVTLESEITLYRARLVKNEMLNKQSMGAPPSSGASAGRANPLGIPYLYLAYDVETCIYESRATAHSRIAIGEFKPTRDLRILNLADISAPDFFSVSDVENVDEQIAQISSFRLLRSLSSELKKPIRDSDHTIDYIPTQYLCEFAKSLNIDGVLYNSSLHDSGRNLVLFDVESAYCTDEPKLIEITGVSATWQNLDS